MAIIFSYDLEDAETRDHNRMQSMFERFGWERIGGSCYRYPTLPRVTSRSARARVRQRPREDWLNDVIPALMCFRSYVLLRGLTLTKHSLDAQSSTGSHGSQPKRGATLDLARASNAQFGVRVLRNWVDAAVGAFPQNYA